MLKLKSILQEEETVVIKGTERKKVLHEENYLMTIYNETASKNLVNVFTQVRFR